jgi:hypothetical protein
LASALARADIVLPVSSEGKAGHAAEVFSGLAARLDGGEADARERQVVAGCSPLSLGSAFPETCRSPGVLHLVRQQENASPILPR